MPAGALMAGSLAVSIMNHYVYVIKSSATGRIYIGSTRNVRQRLKLHNSGVTVSTRKRGPWNLELVEEYPTRSLAEKREAFLKSGEGRRVLRFKGIIQTGV